VYAVRAVERKEKEEENVSTLLLFMMTAKMHKILQSIKLKGKALQHVSFFSSDS
jgi:hypothetical protein